LSPLVPVALGALLLLTGCESSKTKSARLAKGAEEIANRRGIVVKRQNPDVKVLDTAVIEDENGAAAVVAMRNVSSRPLVGLPVSIDVKGGGGKSVFRNDQPGLAPGLAQAALVAPGGELEWVHDQIVPTDRARSVAAKVGDPASRSTPSTPRIQLSAPRIEDDPVSGASAEAYATNRSKIAQREIVIHAVGRKGGSIVAAGRAQIKRLRPGRRTRFEVFFIGNPRGAKVTLSAPPTTLK